MDFNFNDFPALPYAEQNQPREISANTSARAVVGGGAFAPKLNDVFTFPYLDKDGKVIAVEQDVTGSTNVSVTIACDRNGEKSWIRLGELTRVDKDMNPTCDFTAKVRNECPTVEDVQRYLVGKTLKVTAMAPKQFTLFGTTTVINRLAPQYVVE